MSGPTLKQAADQWAENLLFAMEREMSILVLDKVMAQGRISAAIREALEKYEKEKSHE